MAVMAGDLVTRLGLDGRKFQGGLNNARSQARSFAGDVSRIVSGIALADIGVASIRGIVGLGKSIVQLAADAETSRITFGVLVGDVDRGAELFKKIERFAARTSFDLASASDAVKGLLAAGVGEGDVLNTLQLLGDLAMGDANKLGFLSKAYTDVMNKGKLQGQEIRQFAENGVGIVAALAMSKFGNATQEAKAKIIAMSEAGQISFNDLQKALMGLTADGGRFGGMMDKVNKTFSGQWNSLVENVQTVGRELGATVLPFLTEIVGKTNDWLTGFNAIGDGKWTLLGDILTASFDVAFENIKVNWDVMLEEMWTKAKSWFSKIAGLAAVGGNAAQGVAGMMKAAPQDRLKAAEDRLAGLIGQLNAAAQQAKQQAIADMGKPLGADGPAAAGENKLKALAESLWNKVTPFAKSAMESATGMIDRAKIKARSAWETISGLFTGDAAKKAEPQLAGAMQRGSAEAFSTIVQAMLGAKQDPVVKATKEQTKELVKHLKPPKLQPLVAMGPVMG